MRTFLVAGTVLALVSAPLVAQSPDSSGHWELGLYPTVRKLTYDLAAKHEWGGGGTVGIGYRFSRVISLNAELEGAWIPQLNTTSQGQVNELLPTLALQLQIPGNRFRPYVVLGGGHESFHFEAPVVPGTHNLKFWTGHTGVGFRLKLANWAALRRSASPSCRRLSRTPPRNLAGGTDRPAASASARQRAASLDLYLREGSRPCLPLFAFSGTRLVVPA